MLHKFIEIKPIVISDEENKKLSTFIKLKTQKSSNVPESTIQYMKYNFFKKITGTCSQCSKLAEYQVSYDVNGASLLQRYCSTCLEEEKKKGNIERDY